MQLHVWTQPELSSKAKHSEHLLTNLRSSRLRILVCFVVSPNSCGLYIETQLATQTVFKILIFLTFGINNLHVSFSFSVLINFRNLGEKQMHGFLSPPLTATKEQFINDT
jgi:hypothetical protein